MHTHACRHGCVPPVDNLHSLILDEIARLVGSLEHDVRNITRELDLLLERVRRVILRDANLALPPDGKQKVYLR